MQTVLLMLRGLWGIETTAALVLSWLCSKEKEGMVVANTYREELNMTRQHFSNVINELKEAGLISGERGIYTIAEWVPRKKPITYTVKIS